MRDLLVLLLSYGSLPIALLRPFYGLVVLSWLAYTRPQEWAWGIGSHRLSLWMALATLAGLVLNLGRERFATLRAPMILLILLWVWNTVVSYAAVYPELSMWINNLFGKIVLICLLTTGLVRTRQRFRILIVAIAMFLGLVAFKFGLFGLLGGREILGGPGGFMTDNNTFIMAVNMSIPLLYGIWLAERHWMLRWTALVFAAFCVLAVIFSFSRGGLLTLGVVAALLLLRGGRPLIAATILALGVGGFLLFSTPEFQRRFAARAYSVVNYEEDSSAMGRLRLWGISWRLFLDYPVLGIGPENFIRVSTRYLEPGERPLISHSTFFQILTECGLPGLALYAAMLILTLLRLGRIRNRAGPKWAVTYASMIQIALVAFAAGGVFINMAYFDLFYHLVAMGVCLEVVLTEEAAVAGEDAQPPALLPWWKQSQAGAG